MAKRRSACAPSGVGVKPGWTRRQVSSAEHHRHPGHPGERRGERIGVDQRRGLERVGRLEQEQHDLPLGEDLLEVAGGVPVRVVAHHQPVDGPLGRDACRQHGRRRDEQRVEDQDRDAPAPRSGRRCARVGCGKPPRATVARGTDRDMRLTILRSVRWAPLRRQPARAAATEPPVTVVACAPGYPGTTAEAQPSMDAFASALARVAGWSPGQVVADLRADREGGAHPDSAGGGGAGAAALPRAARRRAQADPASRRRAEGTRAHRALDAGGEEGARGQAGGSRGHDGDLHRRLRPRLRARRPRGRVAPARVDEGDRVGAGALGAAPGR